MAEVTTRSMDQVKLTFPVNKRKIKDARPHKIPAMIKDLMALNNSTTKIQVILFGAEQLLKAQ